MFKRTLFLFALTIVLADSAAAQKLVIDVQGVAQRTPVAVVPFGWQGSTPAAPLDVATVIKNDLRRSGRFAPTNENDMLQKPPHGADVDFDDWMFLMGDGVMLNRSVMSKWGFRLGEVTLSFYKRGG